jgi:Na+/H+-dicarboxylate symporter
MMKPEKAAWLGEIKRLETSISKTQFVFEYLWWAMVVAGVAAFAALLYMGFNAILSFSRHQGTAEEFLLVFYSGLLFVFFINLGLIVSHFLIGRLLSLSDERAHLKKFGWNRPKQA